MPEAKPIQAGPLPPSAGPSARFANVSPGILLSVWATAITLMVFGWWILKEVGDLAQPWERALFVLIPLLIATAVMFDPETEVIPAKNLVVRRIRFGCFWPMFERSHRLSDLEAIVYRFDDGNPKEPGDDSERNQWIVSLRRAGGDTIPVRSSATDRDAKNCPETDAAVAQLQTLTGLPVVREGDWK